MDKRTGAIGMKCLCIVWLCLMGVFHGVSYAQGVPAAIKYQAVLRDVEGEPMANRAYLAVRITLRQGVPGGTILYQEEHTDLTTDAFGLLQLEIGRGVVSAAGYGDLLDIPWENSPIYAEVEVQADDKGYTMMGASELLSVPYALYAGNASVGFGLTDGVLPKYDAGYMNLVDSKVSETLSGVLQFYSGEDAYTFPVKRGVRNQALTLIDDEGTLGWRTGGGGGGADCDGCQDGRLTYWDDLNGQLRTTDMRYDEPTGAVYAGNQFISPELMIVEKELEINGTVSGKHNLQYNDLPLYNVWVGGTDGRSKAYVLGSGVTIDSSDAAKPVLQFGGGSSVWIYRPEGSVDYVHTKMDPAKRVRVGVGTDVPETRFQVQDGSFLLSGTDGNPDETVEWTAGNHFYWHSGKGALRMGKFDQDKSGLWDIGNLGANSIALGTNAAATEADNVAIGKDAKAMVPNTMALGQKVLNSGEYGTALGYAITVSGSHAIGIGSGSNLQSLDALLAQGENSIAIGYDVKNYGDNAVGIGQNNTMGDGSAQSDVAGSIVLGSRNEVFAPSTILCGVNNAVDRSSSSAIQMGHRLEIQGSAAAISIGEGSGITASGDAISIGNALTLERGSNYGINLGFGNTIAPGGMSPAKQDYGPVVIGQSLEYAGFDFGVVLGAYNDAPSPDVDRDGPALIVGAGDSEKTRFNALEVSITGDLYAAGSVYANGNILATSDLNLKTDIQPLNAGASVLQALQPVRYRFKADKKQQLQFGFIAQDVEQYFPHLVHTDGKGVKSLNYIGLLPVLWQYTQRLERTTEAQATEIGQLKTELEKVRAELEAIKSTLGIGD